MNKSVLHIVTILLVVVSWLVCTTAGAGPQPAIDGGKQAPDKGQYNILNPTPPDQMRDMDTDRPNHTNTAHTIDAGHLQLEAGIADYTYNRDRHHGANAQTHALSLGDFNIRLGVLNNLEIDTAISSFERDDSKDFTTGHREQQTGFGDMVVGGKLNLWGNDGDDDVWATGLAIQPQFKIPTAKSAIGNGHVEYSLGVPLQVRLPAEFQLGLQVIASCERNSSNSGYVAGWQGSVSIDRVLCAGFDVYVEYWSHVTAERHQNLEQSLDVGFTRPLGKNLALDMGLAFGLNRATDTVEWLTGISARF